jgi:hypothetical protein
MSACVRQAKFSATESGATIVIGAEDELLHKASHATQEADIHIGKDRIIRFLDYESLRQMIGCLMQAARELRYGPLPKVDR